MDDDRRRPDGTLSKPGTGGSNASLAKNQSWRRPLGGAKIVLARPADGFTHAESEGTVFTVEDAIEKEALSRLTERLMKNAKLTEMDAPSVQ